MRSKQVHRRTAFTLVELLVVITIIAVLVGFLMPALQAVRESSRSTACLGNMRELGVAWVQFASDHDGIVPYADTGPGSWVNSGNTATQYTTGELYPYVSGNINVFNCPDASNENITRSYSVNEVFASDAGYWQAVGYHSLRQVKNPARCFVFIEEYDPRGYNEGGFVVPKTGFTWVDFPAHRHNTHYSGTFDSGGNGCNLNFADGHAESWGWSDPRTLDLYTYDMYTPGDSDLTHLQSVIGW